MSKNSQTRRFPRFQIRDVAGSVADAYDADVLDLSMGGALMEHRGMFRIGDRYVLGVATSVNHLIIRCRVVHSQVSRREPDGTLSCRTGVEFLDLTPEDEHTLEAVIRSYGARKKDDYKRGGLLEPSRYM